MSLTAKILLGMLLGIILGSIFNSVFQDNLPIFLNFFSEFIDAGKKQSFFVNYFDKYALYLSKNSFNYFTKDVISLKF